MNRLTSIQGVHNCGISRCIEQNLDHRRCISGCCLLERLCVGNLDGFYILVVHQLLPRDQHLQLLVRLLEQSGKVTAADWEEALVHFSWQRFHGTTKHWDNASWGCTRISIQTCNLLGPGLGLITANGLNAVTMVCFLKSKGGPSLSAVPSAKVVDMKQSLTIHDFKMHLKTNTNKYSQTSTV